MTIGQKLTALRKAKGMTQEELSEAVGVTRQTISKWELDTSTPDLDYLCKLYDLFGVTADYLIRPEKVTVETAEPPEPTPPPTVEIPSEPHRQNVPSFTPRRRSPAKTVGTVLLGMGIAFLPIALLSIFFTSLSIILLLFSGCMILFGLELLFVRRHPSFIVMWTAWILWTGSQAIMTGQWLFSLIFSLHYEATLPMNWTLIFAILWLLYTAFCIGVTVRMIVKHIHSRKSCP